MLGSTTCDKATRDTHDCESRRRHRVSMASGMGNAPLSEELKPAKSSWLASTSRRVPSSFVWRISANRARASGVSSLDSPAPRIPRRPGRSVEALREKRSSSGASGAWERCRARIASPSSRR